MPIEGHGQAVAEWLIQCREPAGLRADRYLAAVIDPEQLMLLQASHFVNHLPACLAHCVVGTLRASPANRQPGKTKRRPDEPRG